MKCHSEGGEEPLLMVSVRVLHERGNNAPVYRRFVLRRAQDERDILVSRSEWSVVLNGVKDLRVVHPYMTSPPTRPPPAQGDSLAT